MPGSWLKPHDACNAGGHLLRPAVAGGFKSLGMSSPTRLGDRAQASLPFWRERISRASVGLIMAGQRPQHLFESSLLARHGGRSMIRFGVVPAAVSFGGEAAPHKEEFEAS